MVLIIIHVYLSISTLYVIESINSHDLHLIVGYFFSAFLGREATLEEIQMVLEEATLEEIQLLIRTRRQDKKHMFHYKY